MTRPLIRRVARNLPLVAALALVAAIPAVTLGPLARADTVHANTMDVADVKVGMKGYGLTVFKGMTPEKFDVEVIGVLSKFRPNQDLILIKTPHERLNIAHTVAGMSGSPIYLDGKMIGAYAYGWGFGSEPIAGVTPIKNMLEDMARPIPAELLKPLPTKSTASPGPKKHASVEGHRYVGSLEEYDVNKHAKQIGDRTAGSFKAPTGSGLAAASNPVLMSGMTDRTASIAKELLAPMGLEALAGGGASNNDPNAPTKYEDGGAIGVQMIRGDISAMGLGTVTRVEGDKLVAFGHPMNQGGISLLPTAIGKVHWIMASAQRSFKIGEAARPLGAMINDQQASIVIDQTVNATIFPISVDVEGVAGAPKTHWDMEIAHDKFMAPSFVGMAMGNTVESTVSERRDATWTSVTKIWVKNYGMIEVSDFGLAIGGTPNADDFMRSRATRAVAIILNNAFEEAEIEKMEMKMKIVFDRNLYTIRGTQLLDREVDAGQKARVEITLRQFNGAEERKVIDIPMPKDLAGREVDIDLIPGWSESPDLPSPDTFSALLANIPLMTYKPDVLLAVYRHKDPGMMYHGQVAHQLPPSAADMLRPASDSQAPEQIASTVRIPFPMGKFIEGRDHVRVKVKEILR